MARLSLLLVAALGWCSCDSALAGGPPPAYDDLPNARGDEAVDLPLPGRGSVTVPRADLVGRIVQGVHELERMASLQDDVEYKAKYPEFYHHARPAVVTLDDLDRLDAEPQPPLRYSLPVDFRDANIAVVPYFKGLTDYLPASVVSWLPALPSLGSLVPSLPGLPNLPSYIPGVEFEAEVHRGPVSLPHIPRPAELLQRVNQLVGDALGGLHRRQDQIVELIKCSCPRPARCEGLFQEFDNPNKVPAQSQSSAPAGSGFGSGEPGLSFFAELTRPGGEHGPGFGFFVDETGAHVGHHIHNSSAQAATTSTSSAPTAAPTAAPAASGTQPQATHSDGVEFPKS